MTFKRIHHVVVTAAMLGAGAIGPALAESASRAVTVTYQDLTGTQPMSSAAFVSHQPGVHLWVEGKPAEVTIKRMAEEGNPEWIVGMAVFDADHRFLDEAVAIPTPPHGKRSVTLTVDAAHPLVSGAWMLGMTNDGFAGIDAIDAIDLDHPMTLEVYALDAGTRKNSEKREHTAGLGGLEEDPENGVVARHPGIRGGADIPASFKFDPSKPVARVTLTPVRSGSS
ncbi:MAG: spondin domain-containing protein [Acetobacteraceae bacterium]|nr:spondin domain-containing protein [Acetobacteraceae bacterium]